MRGDTQAQNDGGRDGASPKGQHAWGKGSEGQAVVHRARRDWQGSPGAGNLHSAQISSRLLCSGLPSGTFSAGAGEAGGRGV